MLICGCCARTLWLLDKSQADTARPVAKLWPDDAGVRIEAASLWRLDKTKEVVLRWGALQAILISLRLSGDAAGADRAASKEAIALQDWLKASAGDRLSTNSAVEALHRIGEHHEPT